MGLYLGISLQYYATIDLEGFTHMIDVVGGLTLCLPGRLVDPTYNGPGDTWGPARGVELPAGCSQYDGQHALAYARARKGYIEMPDGSREQLDDFKRADRQQKVLLELRREFAQLDIFFELPDMLEAIGSTVATDFPRAKAGDLASLLPLITGPDIERVVLDLPTYVDPPLEPNVNYMLIPRRDDIRVGDAPAIRSRVRRGLVHRHPARRARTAKRPAPPAQPPPPRATPTPPTASA